MARASEQGAQMSGRDGRGTVATVVRERRAWSRSDGDARASLSRSVQPSALRRPQGLIRLRTRTGSPTGQREAVVHSVTRCGDDCFRLRCDGPGNFPGPSAKGVRAVQHVYPRRPRCRQIDGTVRPPKFRPADSSYGGGKLTPPVIPRLELRGGARSAPPRWCRFGTTGGLSRGCRLDTPVAEPRPGTAVRPSPADLRWLRFHTAAARSWTCGAGTLPLLSHRRKASVRRYAAPPARPASRMTHVPRIVSRMSAVTTSTCSAVMT